MRPGDPESLRFDALRPKDHRNPIARDLYDVLVVGGGPAGLVAAFGGAALGARVAIVERNLLGGDCTNVGCVPSKAYLRSARAAAEVASAARRGVVVPAGARTDFRAVVERMRRLRAVIARNDAVERLVRQGVHVFFGTGRFTGREVFEVEGAKLRFRRAILATGSRPAVPPIEGLAGSGFLTNETVFDIEDLPERLACLGGGPIGCELAQAFARFGSRVELLEREERLLSHDDPAAAAIVARALERDGVLVRTHAEAARVRREQEDVVLTLKDGADLRADALLVALGRKPNVDDLGLDVAGVALDGQSHRVRVDRALRTANRRIYAAGDVASPLAFTHAADAMARVALRNALFPGSVNGRDLVIPWCTYTDPEVAHVGIGAGEAAQRDDVETVVIELADVDRAVLDETAEGFVKLHVAARGERILGATIVGAHAGELIGEVALAMEAGVGVTRFGAVVRPYPTLSLALRHAADRHRRERLTPRTKRLLRGWFSWQRRLAGVPRD